MGVNVSYVRSREVLGRAKSGGEASSALWRGVELSEWVRRSLVLGGVVGMAKRDGSVLPSLLLRECEQGSLSLATACTSTFSAEHTISDSFLLNLALCSFSSDSSSSKVASPSTAPRSSSSQVLHTVRPNPGTTFPKQLSWAQVARPGVFALSSVLVSTIGLLVFAHSERLAKVTRLDEVGEREREGRASGPPAFPFFDFEDEKEERVSRNAGEGASVGTVGRSRGVACGVHFRVGMGVAAGVGGREKPRPRAEGRRSGGRRSGGTSFRRGRRKVLHSVQGHDMLRRETGVMSILDVR